MFWCLINIFQAQDPTCSTEREEDILDPERLLVGDVSARKARLVQEKNQLIIFQRRLRQTIFNRMNRIGDLDVDLSISLVDPFANPSPSPLDKTWFSFDIVTKAAPVEATVHHYNPSDHKS